MEGSPPQNKERILVVDDDPRFLRLTTRLLQNEGYEVASASDGESALDLLEDLSFDLLVVDLVMGRIGGFEVFAKARSQDPCCGIMVVTGSADVPNAVRALRLRADEFLCKPINSEELLRSVEACLARCATARKIKLRETMITACCVCHRIRDDTATEPGTGPWLEISDYLYRRGKVNVSHTFCPQCVAQSDPHMRGCGDGL